MEGSDWFVWSPINPLGLEACFRRPPSIKFDIEMLEWTPPKQARPEEQTTEAESPDSFVINERRYDTDLDTKFDMTAGEDAEITEFVKHAIGGYLDPTVYDTEGDVRFDLPPNAPDLKEIDHVARARRKEQIVTDAERLQRYKRITRCRPKWAVKGADAHGLLEVVADPFQPPFNSIGRVFIDNSDGNSFQASCFRPKFVDERADALLRPNEVVSSAHLVEPLEGVAAGHVRFRGPNGEKYDYSIKHIRVPRDFHELAKEEEKLAKQQQEKKGAQSSPSPLPEAMKQRMETEKRKVDYCLLQLVPLKEAPDVSEVVPALPTSVGRGQTPLGAIAVITKIGYGRMHHDEEPELLKDQGHFLVEFGHGEAFASQGKMRRGMSGGPSTCGGGVVGVNAAGSQTQDYNISSRIHLSRLQNMVESTVEWQGLGW